MKNILFLFLSLASATALPLDVQAEEKTAKSAQYFAKKGMAHAELFPGLTNLCDIESEIRDLSKRKRNSTSAKKKKSGKSRSSGIPATKVFDNLYYVGTGGVSSWVIETSDGLILIDALNTVRQAKEYIEKGMLALGLNPADTKYLIISHEHGDHYGGQAHFVGNYKTKVVMSDVAWSRMENNKLTVFSPRWGPMPKRDITVKDGETISLGDTQVQVYETPGHTPGTISLIFPVFDNGKKHMISLWGGTGLNYGPDLARIQSYTDAASRFGNITKAQGVDVFLSNHPTRDGSREKLKLMAERSKDQPHPFVQGSDVVAKAYEMLASCTQAQVLRIQQQEK
ncbi:MBL fold metallo-hydrolase [Pseudoalteromonas sp. SCSIO 43201]|uniref:MBL fold metallo-hydrolase n=1 Tax=Pseudoalteromonas TaxID=53246 RepID=UPI002075640A|nr:MULTISPECIES: MBL fold metallo-hydrolase [Pseudoalteromonas]MDW7547415.1 MBL fold metallo-hydrolase [Pseudoalteromonas peptidolytica]USD27931.1 MBL fold metallo-hydrolase [Pseudoalteromonas sp. SCSIO 43201]